MRELKEYFSGKGKLKGYVFNQISNAKHGFIYEVKGVDSIHYEVFKRVENRMYDVISYPTEKAFGRWAWTCMSLERAKEKLNEIENLVDEKI